MCQSANNGPPGLALISIWDDGKESAPKGTRTPNHLVRSQVLYPLSYRCIVDKKIAKGGTRTPTSVSPLPPQGSASANSATFARCEVENIQFAAILTQVLKHIAELLPKKKEIGGKDPLNCAYFP